MKKLFSIIIPASLALILAGCTDPVNPKEELSVEIDGSITAKGGKVRVNVTSNSTWTVFADEPWLSSETTSGKGNETVIFEATRNLGKFRKATITVKGTENTIPKSIQQASSILGVSPDSIVFPTDAEAVQVVVSSPGEWRILNTEDAPWVTFSKSTATTGEVITITPKPLTERIPRGPAVMKFASGSNAASLSLEQEIPNNSPSAPQLISPSNGEILDESEVIFSWNESIDPDGDAVAYSLYLSENQTTWTKTVSGLSETTCKASFINGTYYWKVIATDIMGASTESAVGHFTIAMDNYDGMVYVYQSNSVPGALPVNIVFIGDGYIKSDYDAGGIFEQHLKTSIDTVFDIEPYKTYKDYFKVTVINAYSAEQGVTILTNYTSGSKMKAQTKNSKFGSECAGGNSTVININGELIQSYVKSALGISNLNTYSIFMTINVDAWAGTCSQYSSGLSIARSAADYNLGKRMVHEGAGHGTGRLKDEYFTEGAQVTQAKLTNINSWRAGDPWSYAGNIDYVGNRSATHWSHYFTMAGYETVGFTEGGDTFGKGTWRPGTQKNIMEGSASLFYFNPPSREAIVRRIMKLAGLPFNMNDFLAKDVRTIPAGTRSDTDEIYPPDTPPEMIDDLGLSLH